jgi:hypothetical protein
MADVTLIHAKDGEEITVNVQIDEISVSALDEALTQAFNTLRKTWLMIYTDVTDEATEGDG